MNLGDLQGLALLVLPLLLGTVTVWARLTGGTRRLLLVAAIAFLLLIAVPLFLTTTIWIYDAGPLLKAAVESWTLPASALAAALVTQLLAHRRMSPGIRVGAATAAALLAISVGWWQT